MATVTSAYKPPRPSKDALIHAYRVMYLARKIDDKEIQLKRQNRAFFQMNGDGHEAFQAAAAMHLKPGVDWFYPYYRDRAFCLQLGLTALDMLLAMNTGHDGSLTTIHANSPREVFSRLVQATAIRSSGGFGADRGTIVEIAASALKLIVQVVRAGDHRRLEA